MNKQNLIRKILHTGSCHLATILMIKKLQAGRLGVRSSLHTFGSIFYCILMLCGLHCLRP